MKKKRAVEICGRTVWSTKEASAHKTDDLDVTDTTEVNWEKQNDINVETRGPALRYILISIDLTSKAIVRKRRYPAEAWRLLKTTFQAVPESTINAKLPKVQAVKMKKAEEIVPFSN